MDGADKIVAAIELLPYAQKQVLWK